MPSPSHSNSPVSFRMPPVRRTSSMSRRSTPRSFTARMQKRIEDLSVRGIKLWLSLTPLQKTAVVICGILSFISSILSLVYHDQIFHWLADFAKGWRNVTGGWLILWLMTFIVSFPPLIGYSTCVSLGGFVYGFPNGWFIVASASTCGSMVAFITSRTLFQRYVNKWVAGDSRFTALSTVLKHDGLKLLCMVRLCPLPYSISNGAISTIPTVTWYNFGLATAIVSPKLMLHVWIGHQLAELAERGDKMDTRTKVVTYISIAIGATVGAVTGYLIYQRTQKRIKEVEELTRAEEGTGRRVSGDEFDDDPELAETDEFLREEADDISLREDLWDDEYRDESSDGVGGSGNEDTSDEIPSRKGLSRSGLSRSIL
ncbi:hypothetical protein BT63DRAFT_474342 [Microthyrium microscopicum]|uniref:Golgi apparatus membrane protein TVP38 n=1 Tax=Microthyrium microscopicum TaxID=703497 RepID=A0A6A6UQP8_9PEZI|nr:hypothetical protein BT63DRAFT_474342 [Microthyrium microscopicum]